MKKFIIAVICLFVFYHSALLLNDFMNDTVFDNYYESDLSDDEDGNYQESFFYKVKDWVVDLFNGNEAEDELE